ncbi:MAG: hypothetical protein HY508_06005 [Acidobacteria bacterium]|nr:hypothetical protein [Acidobacteriota bacterium]
MIRDAQSWADWEARYLASEPADFRRNLRLLEAMYEHARALGVFPLADPMEGLETDIRVAKALNVRTTP